MNETLLKEYQKQCQIDAEETKEYYCPILTGEVNDCSKCKGFEEGLSDFISERLFDKTIFTRKEFDMLMKSQDNVEYINSVEVEIAGKPYSIEVYQMVYDGEEPDSANTKIFVIEESVK